MTLDNIEWLNKKGYLKRYDKVLEKIGRLKQKYSRVAKHYKAGFSPDDKTCNRPSFYHCLIVSPGSQHPLPLRKSTRPEPRQQTIYSAVGVCPLPGRAVKKNNQQK